MLPSRTVFRSVFSQYQRTHTHRLFFSTNLQRCQHTQASSQDNKSPLEQWRDQISRKKIIEKDVITASQFNLMGNTMNDPIYRNQRLPSTGTELPPAWHLAYFPPRVTEQELSPDGFEQDWKPPAPFHHRMWAGGELEWNPENPLRVGDEARMESTIRDIQFRPAGRRGDSVFIWVDKKISNDKGWVMTESRCWVYVQGTDGHKKEDSSSSNKKEEEVIKPKQPTVLKELPKADFSLDLTPSPILLFRFSALTFNSHLIHYDNIYSTTVEGHRGCLVHGPMSFMLMINELNKHLKTKDDTHYIKSLSYRCRSPLVVNEPIQVQGKAKSDVPGHYDVWVADQNGNMAVKGSAIVGRIGG
ncbi:hypothetical protein BDA99DRAFT_520029 [Phascolomyces articulosus]|uniref:N-terminal of MaoC-like dehydratase domain-containing protein n=1 Tax=Phascolomyces articulosus TaxID=60185 RepID=A0AAD5PAN6_9FUNG|nr:hypothetical protein BDA99DRAFT_520029 [Phascolomyces articulosus]